MTKRKNKGLKESHFSVIMPTYNQGTFIRRAIHSLFSQKYKKWELIIINDGSTDDTELLIADFLNDHRIHYIRNSTNQGMGFAINQGMDYADGEWIAYLPSDDYFYENHLKLIKQAFNQDENIGFVYTNAKSEILDSFTSHNVKKETSHGIFISQGLQMVQVAHKNTEERWVTRNDFVTDDLYEMFWNKLNTDQDLCIHVDIHTCCWSIHAFQRHMLINDMYGGSLTKYKQYYGIKTPIKLIVKNGKTIDEWQIYKNFLSSCTPQKEGLKILLLGDLSYNAERIYALEQAGHKLYGLWSQNTASWTTVGPLPIGSLVNIPYNSNWKSELKKINPDVIYAQSTHHAVLIAHEIIDSNLNIPFIWHFKESPFVCMQNGYWEKLIDIYRKADGRIFPNKELMDWYSLFIPIPNDESCLVLDGDLAKADYFMGQVKEKLSKKDGQIHTVISGRTLGLSLDLIKHLSNHNIHIHSYTDNDTNFNQRAQKVAPKHYHVHPFCPPLLWRQELSQYDAGWLHCIPSNNQGNIMKATWDDLNLPCRISTYAAASLPLIQLKNSGHLVASNNYIASKNVDILFDSPSRLVELLNDKKYLYTKQSNMETQRLFFSFDYHVPRIIDLFKWALKKEERQR